MDAKCPRDAVAIPQWPVGQRMTSADILLSEKDDARPKMVISAADAFTPAAEGRGTMIISHSSNCPTSPRTVPPHCTSPPTQIILTPFPAQG